MFPVPDHACYHAYFNVYHPAFKHHFIHESHSFIYSDSPGCPCNHTASNQQQQTLLHPNPYRCLHSKVCRKSEWLLGKTSTAACPRKAMHIDLHWVTFNISITPLNTKLKGRLGATAAVSHLMMLVDSIGLWPLHTKCFAVVTNIFSGTT